MSRFDDNMNVWMGGCAVSLGPDALGSQGAMRIRDFYFVGSCWGSQQFGHAGDGDLGMVPNPLLALLPPVLGGLNRVETMIDDALTLAAAMVGRFAKGLNWADGADPLIRDLDGEGIETSALDTSDVYFEVDGDLFAERTAWLKGDDGFLVVDANGNGWVDDISEMFGDRTQGGYAELAGHDSNGDCKITMADAMWAELKVWQDGNRDGATDAGELRSLDQLGIIELSLASSPLGATTSEGARLLSSGSVTFDTGRVSRICRIAAANDNEDVWREAPFCLVADWEGA